jgi:hypothetical protein
VRLRRRRQLVLAGRRLLTTSHAALAVAVPLAATADRWRVTQHPGGSATISKLQAIGYAARAQPKHQGRNDQPVQFGSQSVHGCSIIPYGGKYRLAQFFQAVSDNASLAGVKSAQNKVQESHDEGSNRPQPDSPSGWNQPVNCRHQSGEFTRRREIAGWRWPPQRMTSNRTADRVGRAQHQRGCCARRIQMTSR